MPGYSISNVNFEHVIASWENKSTSAVFKMFKEKYFITDFECVYVVFFIRENLKVD